MIFQTSVPPEASPSSPAPRPKKGQGSKAWGWMGLLLGAAALVFFVESFLIFPIRVEGGSMCAMGGMTPYPVRSALTHYPQDFGIESAPAAMPV